MGRWSDRGGAAGGWRAGTVGRGPGEVGTHPPTLAVNPDHGTRRPIGAPTD